MALAPQDAALVAAAANDGRIASDNVVDWVCAMIADPAGTRAAIAKLAPLPTIVSKAAGVAYGQRGVEETLRRMGVNAPPGSVAAAAAPLPAPGSALPQLPYDSVGLPIPPIPGPVRLVSGKPPEEWTKTERDNALLRQMFPGLRDRIPPAPGSVSVYQPTGREHSLPVQHENGDIEWVPNPNYRPGD
jgi:hypothetical protein